MQFIFGIETYWVRELASKLVQNFEGEVINFDQSALLGTIFEEILTLSMFDKKKLIVIRNHALFSEEQMAKQFIYILKQAPHDVDFLFIWESETLDQKNTLINFLLNNAKIHEIKSLNEKNVIQVIQDLVKKRGGTITNTAAINLSIKLPLNLWIIVNEIDKLLVNNLNIGDETVEESTNDYAKDNYFALSNAILSRDYHSIIRAYQERINLGDEATFIINQIAKVLEVAITVNAYYKQGLTNQEIAKVTKLHIFRVKKGYELVELVGQEKVKNLLQDLATLDFKIKLGKLDKQIGLEQFILKLLQ